MPRISSLPSGVVNQENRGDNRSGAREDAEGVGCILNIVTDSETSLKGVVGSANLYVDNYSYYPRPNLWLSTQVDKVTMALNGGFGITRIRAVIRKGIRRRSRNIMNRATGWRANRSTVPPTPTGGWGLKAAGNPTHSTSSL